MYAIATSDSFLMSVVTMSCPASTTTIDQIAPDVCVPAHMAAIPRRGAGTCTNCPAHVWDGVDKAEGHLVVIGEFVVTCLAAALSGPVFAQAQTPDRPLRAVVAFGTSGATDVIARIIATSIASRGRIACATDVCRARGQPVGSTM